MSELFDALEEDEKQLAVELIQHGANVAFVGQSSGLGKISCVCLSAVKMPSILPDLLQHGGSVHVNDVHERSGKSVLMLAIEHKADRNTVEQLVRAGANLKWADNTGKTAFSVLKSMDQLHGVLDADISVEDIENEYKFSTLGFILTRDKDPEDGDILYFLEKGADPNFFKDGETSLLTLAYKNRFRNEEDIRILLRYGADPEHTDDLGFTVLQNIVSGDGDLKYGAAHLLLDFRAKPDPVLENIENMMDRCSDEDAWIKLGRRLLECSADPKQGRQPLSVAIERNLFTLSEELVKHGASINVVDGTGRSPLDYACQSGLRHKDFRCLLFLLNYPTKLCMDNFNKHISDLEETVVGLSTSDNPSTVTIDVRGVFHLFVAGVDLIDKHGSDFSLCSLAYYGLFETIVCLMRCGWDISAQKDWLSDLETGETAVFVIRKCEWRPQITKDKTASVSAVFNEIESQPMSLQNLCRRKIRGELASFGHSILPLIEKLIIPAKLKSFLKFEECEFLKEEKVTLKLDAVLSDYSDNWYDDDFDTNNFTDSYSDND